MVEQQLTSSEQIATHLRQVHFGGNWTAVSLKEKLDGIDWMLATRRVGTFHTIAELVYHMNYYVSATLQVLEGDPLEAKDKLSFDVAPIESQEDWEQLLKKTWHDAESLARWIERLPEDRLWETFVKPEYGNYYRCLVGTVEHCHYHLGQIALMKKLLENALN